MTKFYFLIASSLISYVATAQGNNPSCVINCPENVIESVGSGVSSKLVNYAVNFECTNFTSDCNIEYPIDNVANQVDGNHAVNTNWAGLSWIVANDFDVPQGETLNITSFIPTLMYYAMEGDIYFYENNNGQPGNLITSFQAVTMDDIIPIGTTIYDGPVYEAVYNLPTPVELTAGKYWVAFHAEMLNPPSIYSSVYWATGGVGNIADNGVRAFKSSDGGLSWNTSGSMQNSDGAFKLKYQCEEPTLIMTEGLNSGEAFPIGETVVTHQLVLGEEILDTCTFTVTIQETLGVNDMQKDNFQLYPNPIIDYLNIESTELISKIAIYSLDGKLINTFDVNNKSINIDFTSYATGIYLVKEISRNNQGKAYKVIKK